MRLSNGVKFNSKTAIFKLMRITIDRRNLGDELNDIIANPGRVKGRELISYAIDYLRRSRESDDRSAAEYLWAASTLAVEALGAYRENQKIVSLRDQWMYLTSSPPFGGGSPRSWGLRPFHGRYSVMIHDEGERLLYC